MDVDFPVTVGDSPAWLAPLQHPERTPLHIAFLEEPVEELFRLRLQAPMVRMKRYVVAGHSSLEERWLRERPDDLPHRPSLAWVPLRELKFHRSIFLALEADHEDPLPDLGHAEILRVQFALEDREPRRGEEPLEEAEEFSVCFVSQPED